MFVGAASSRTLTITSTKRVQKERRSKHRIKLATHYKVPSTDVDMGTAGLTSSARFSPAKSSNNLFAITNPAVSFSSKPKQADKDGG